MTGRAAIYTRISRDAAGEGAGVARQETECRALAARRGLDVVHVYSDNSLSAYSGRKPRPGYEELLRAVRAGTVDAVIVYAADRLHRRISDLEVYVDASEVHGVPTYTVTGGDLDLATPGGRMTARILGAVARNESEQKAARQRSANAARARQGTVDLVRKPFGWDLVDRRLITNEAEADAIRDAYRVIITGGSLREIARRWNAAGLLPPQGRGYWDGSTVGLTLRLPRMAGYRTYHHEIVRHETGQPVLGDWEPIVDPETWQTAQVVLNDPGRRTRPLATSRMLLSGIATCGKCGTKIESGGYRQTPRGRVRRLRCKRGCIYRESEPVIDLVVESVLLHLAHIDPSRFRPKSDAGKVARLRDELAELDARGFDLAALVADGTMTASEFRAAKERLTLRRSQVEGQLPKVSAIAGARGELVSALDILRVWEALTDDQKRATIAETAEVVLVPPGTKENALIWQDAEWDDEEEAYIKLAGWVCNPETVRIRWLI